MPNAAKPEIMDIIHMRGDFGKMSETMLININRNGSQAKARKRPK